MKISPSELAAFLRCRRAFDYGVLRHLVPLGTPATALWLGTGIHEALQRYYDPRRPEDVPLPALFAAWTGEPDQLAVLDGWDAPTYRTTSDLGGAMCSTYASTYGPAPADDPDVAAVLTCEQEFDVPLPGGDGRLIGRIDGLIRAREGGLWVVDHKTYSRAPDAGDTYLRLQFGCYAWALQELAWGGALAGLHVGRDEAIQGVLYNGLRKQAPGPRVRAALTLREWIPMPDGAHARFGDRLAAIHHDLARAVEERAGGALYPTSGDHCGRCDFLSPCLALHWDGDAEYLLGTRYRVAPPRGEVYRADEPAEEGA